MPTPIEDLSRAEESRRWRRFLWLWSAEMLSITGTGLSAFALGAWVYARTHDTTAFALLSVAAILPGHLLLPVSGVLADVLPRRRVMWVCNLVAGLSTIALIALLHLDVLSHALLYLLLCVSALCRTLQWITFTATMTDMVPPAQIGRMSALIYVGEAGQQILAPMAAALLLPFIGYVGVMGIDAGTFAFALLVLGVIPVPVVGVGRRSAMRRDLRHTLVQGWRFILERRGLLVLQVFFAVSQFLGGFLPILTLPALMELTGSERTTGLTMGCAGFGLVAGSLLLSSRPVRRKRVRATILFDVLASGALVVLGLGTLHVGAWWIGLWGFVFLAFHAAESGVSQDLWQRKVPTAIQGRVFAIRRFISWSLVPVCYLIAGPLVDDVLTPHMATPGFTTSLFGEGKLGAMLLLMSVAALARLILLAPATLLSKSLWRIEQELPDHV